MGDEFIIHANTHMVFTDTDGSVYAYQSNTTEGQTVSANQDWKLIEWDVTTDILTYQHQVHHTLLQFDRHDIHPWDDNKLSGLLQHYAKPLRTRIEATPDPDTYSNYNYTCKDNQLPDGPTCPACGQPRAPSGVDGGSWVHIKPQPLCQFCKQAIEPDTCYCGVDEGSHHTWLGHSFVPRGCDCLSDNQMSEPYL